MNDKAVSIMTRRGFLRQAACAALGTGALTSAIGDLRFINSAVAASFTFHRLTTRLCAPA